MSKFFQVGSRQDSLSYIAAAPNRETAIKLVEAMTGPMNPAAVLCKELSTYPPGYKLTGQIPCLMEEDPEYDG